LRIGIVLSKPPTYSETFFNSKIKGLQKYGHEVILFTQKNDEQFLLCKVITSPKVYSNVLFQSIASALVLIKVIPSFKRLRTFIKLEKQAKRSKKQRLKNVYNNSHILTSNLDWLHFGFATMALQSEHVAKAINAKMAVSFRGFDIDVYPLKYPNCYDLIWKNVDKVHSISNYLLEKAKALGLPKSIPSQIIYPAVSVSKFTGKNKHQTDVIQFTTLARLHWMKGLNYTLEALAIVKNKGVNFNFNIIGSGATFEELAFTINQLELIEEVNLVGVKNDDEVVDYLSKTDVYLQYSNSEGFCNAVIEAQAMGILCIVSNGGALQENIINNETGWLVPKRNPEALAKKIIEVLNLPEVEKNNISKQAQFRVQEQFNLDQQNQQFEAFYKTT